MATLRISSQSKQAVLISQSLRISGVVTDPTSFAVATAWLPAPSVPDGSTTWRTADWETLGTTSWAIRTYIGPGASFQLAASPIPYVPYVKLTTSTEVIVQPSTDVLEVY